jgi:hypothetical protein
VVKHQAAAVEGTVCTPLGPGPLQSAYSVPVGEEPREPTSTTHHQSLKATVDYIFHRGLVLRRACSMLTPQELQRHGDEIPNQDWPSDHMALCADFTLPLPDSAEPEPQV